MINILSFCTQNIYISIYILCTVCETVCKTNGVRNKSETKFSNWGENEIENFRQSLPAVFTFFAAWNTYREHLKKIFISSIVLALIFLVLVLVFGQFIVRNLQLYVTSSWLDTNQTDNWCCKHKLNVAKQRSTVLFAKFTNISWGNLSIHGNSDLIMNLV